LECKKLITQIYNITTAKEALEVIEAGADFIGMVPPQKLTYDGIVPGEISHEKIEEIMRVSEGKAKRVLLYAGDLEEVYYEGASLYRPDIIHLAGKKIIASKEFTQKMKSMVPGILIEQSVPITDEQSIEIALQRAEYADMLILDSVSPKLRVVGASGEAHDWSIDREIVRRVSIPVIVAGGLSPENVAQAIKIVNPYGVDTLTRTNMVLPDGTVCKDTKRVHLFCKIAKSMEHQK
jgi:phosphoribosylanthranilate isomerase